MKKVFNVPVLFIAAWLSLGNNVTKASPVFATGLFSKSHTINGLSKWELPAILKEVSGIKYLGNNRFACIQDKMGTIFIYNTNDNKIEKEIPFAKPGNYEGIAIAGASAYVVQSNGTLYEVQDYEGATPLVKQYSTFLKAKNNVEGLTYDKKNDRLLLVTKGNAPRNHQYKGVYAFDLKSKRLAAKPVVKINLADPIFSSIKGKNTDNTFQPSAIEIHPLTNDIYIFQGNDPKLLVMDAKGNMKKMYTYRPSDFSKAEGLAFSPEGDLFISNAGTTGAATIVKVGL